MSQICKEKKAVKTFERIINKINKFDICNWMKYEFTRAYGVYIIHSRAVQNNIYIYNVFTNLLFLFYYFYKMKLQL